MLFHTAIARGGVNMKTIIASMFVMALVVMMGATEAIAQDAEIFENTYEPLATINEPSNATISEPSNATISEPSNQTIIRQPAQQYVKISNPEKDSSVSGIVTIKVRASSTSKINYVKLNIQTRTNEITEIMSCRESGSMNEFDILCGYQWDSTEYSGQSAIITVKAINENGEVSQDFTKVWVSGETTVPTTGSIVIKAFDSNTNRPVQASSNIMQLTSIECKETNNCHGIYLGTIAADGIDTISLQTGTYRILTFAKGYPIHEQVVNVDSGEVLGLYASMENYNPPQHPDGYRKEGITIIEDVDEGRIIKRLENIEIKELENENVKKEVSIERDDEGKLELKSNGVSVTTDLDIELDRNKLYLKNEKIKTPITIHPDKAKEILSNTTQMLENAELTLEMLNERSVYIATGEEDGYLLAFIPVKIPIRALIDAQTGELNLERPWWSFLA